LETALERQLSGITDDRQLMAGQRPLQLVADHVILHFSLLSHFEGVIYLNFEIANCTLQPIASWQ